MNMISRLSVRSIAGESARSHAHTHTHTHTHSHRQVAPCRSFAINHGMMLCELYLVDDTYAMFNSTWLFTDVGWITYVAAEVNY
jgi:hypothetical protein